MMYNQFSTKKFSLTALSISILLGYSVNAWAKVYYVKQGSGTGNDGSSWSQAFDNLDSALAAAKANPGSDQIWIANGTYRPSLIYAPNGVVGGSYGVNTHNLKTFNLPSDVAIYGGFKGNENSLSARNRDKNPTILSGDLSGNDVNDSSNTSTNKLDNAWHVLTAGNDVSKTGVTGVLLDSVIIRNGYAGGPDLGTLAPSGDIATLDYTHASGGGLLVRYGSQVHLENVKLEYNASDGAGASVAAPAMPPFFLVPVPKASGGGGISAVDEDTLVTINKSELNNNSTFYIGSGGGAINAMLEASVTISGSTLANNRGNRFGGAIRARDAMNIKVSDSIFKNNSLVLDFPDAAGGAISIFNSNLSVSNALFQENSAPIGGGAIFFHAAFDHGDAYVFEAKNSVFKDNSTGGVGGGAINLFGILPNAGTRVKISDCEFKNNVGGLGGGLYVDSIPTTVSDSVFIENKAWLQGGAVSTQNFADALFGISDLTLRPMTTISKTTFNNNAVIGVPSDVPLLFGIIPLTPFNLFNNIGGQFGGQGVSVMSSGGGGIAVEFGGNLNLDQSVFTNNTAIGYGGALLVGGTAGSILGLNQAYANINKVTCKQNTATVGGDNTYVLDPGNLGPSPNGVQLVGSCQ